MVRKITLGAGCFMTWSTCEAHASSTGWTLTGSAPGPRLSFTITRAMRFLWVQLVTGLAIKAELGTMTDARSKVSISVERTEMLFTIPSVVPTTIQSPVLIGR